MISDDVETSYISLANSCVENINGIVVTLFMLTISFVREKYNILRSSDFSDFIIHRLSDPFPVQRVGLTSFLLLINAFVHIVLQCGQLFTVP